MSFDGNGSRAHCRYDVDVLWWYFTLAILPWVLLMDWIDIKIEIGNMLFSYYESLPEPKPNYVEWYYGSKVPDALDELLLGDKPNAPV